MTRIVALFEDGTALVGGSVEADGSGERTDLPYLTEAARLSAVRNALAMGNDDAAEAAALNGVLDLPEDLIVVTFVGMDQWHRYGDLLWDRSGRAHAVFARAMMLVGEKEQGIAVIDCCGRPFVDEASRRDAAAWALRSGLDDIAQRIVRTPIGGPGPHCTWPDRDIEPSEVVEDEEHVPAPSYVPGEFGELEASLNAEGTEDQSTEHLDASTHKHVDGDNVILFPQVFGVDGPDYSKY